MVEENQIHAKRQANAQPSPFSDEATENDYEEIFNSIIECAMIFYLEDKLEQLLENKNMEKKWNDKLTRSFDRYMA